MCTFNAFANALDKAERMVRALPRHMSQPNPSDDDMAAISEQLTKATGLLAAADKERKTSQADVDESTTASQAADDAADNKPNKTPRSKPAADKP